MKNMNIKLNFIETDVIMRLAIVKSYRSAELCTYRITLVI